MRSLLVRSCRIALAISVLVPLRASAGGTEAVPLTFCGTQVGRAHVRLIGDLDCSAKPSPAVVLEDGASLDLAGYILTGPTIPGVVTVLCKNRCRVT